LVEADAQDLSALREMRPPVLEDRPAREARRRHASKKKQVKETAKKRLIRKAKEVEALKKLWRQQAIDGVPLAESPSETVSGEDDDDSDGEDNDALSRYEAATGLGDLPDIRPLLEPVGGSSSSVVVVEKTEEEAEKEAGPSTGGATLPWAQQGGSTEPPAPIQAPPAQAEVGAAAPASSSVVPPVGVRTLGQLASEAQRMQGGVSARAPRSARPTATVGRPGRFGPSGVEALGADFRVSVRV
jgi:hypothetical protein